MTYRANGTRANDHRANGNRANVVAPLEIKEQGLGNREQECWLREQRLWNIWDVFILSRISLISQKGIEYCTITSFD